MKKGEGDGARDKDEEGGVRWGGSVREDVVAYVGVFSQWLPLM